MVTVTIDPIYYGVGCNTHVAVTVYHDEALTTSHVQNRKLKIFLSQLALFSLATFSNYPLTATQVLHLRKRGLPHGNRTVRQYSHLQGGFGTGNLATDLPR